MILKEELKYSKSHEWVALDGDSAVVGLTDYAQSELGDLVFVNRSGSRRYRRSRRSIRRRRICKSSIRCLFTGNGRSNGD